PPHPPHPPPPPPPLSPYTTLFRSFGITDSPVILRIEQRSERLLYPGLSPGHADKADTVAELFEVPIDREGATRLRLLIQEPPREDRKSTRLNSSHVSISYAVFCLI